MLRSPVVLTREALASQEFVLTPKFGNNLGSHVDEIGRMQAIFRVTHWSDRSGSSAIKPAHTREKRPATTGQTPVTDRERLRHWMAKARASASQR
jgi:hypothetical protein